MHDETGQGRLTVFFQQAGPAWKKSFFRPVAITPEWKTYQFAFPAAQDHSPGSVEGQLCFGFGGREQTIEIAQVHLTNHGQDTAPNDLPQTENTYAGRALDASWRAEAQQRIEQYRKTDLSITIVDEHDIPIRDARVTVQQRSHAFKFGTAVSIAAINDPSPDGERYRTITREWFNTAVIESGLKWHAWVGEWEISGEGTTEDALQWLNEAGLHVKGHVLIWPAFRWMPSAISELKDAPEALRTVINQRVYNAAAQYRPYVDSWDVINEPVDCREVMDILGDDVVAPWFQLAKEASPDTPLYINDYGTLTGGDANNTPHRQRYHDIIQELLEQNAPLEGIGMQSHFGEHLTPPEALIEVLDRFAQFNLPLQITEFDIDTNDEQLQADYTRDFMTAVFSHPQVEAFIMWGFWQERHWRPKAAMLTTDWTPKPNAKAYHDLVYKTWWTHTNGITSPKGHFATRAFYGNYDITVSHKNHRVTQQFALSATNKELRIKLTKDSSSKTQDSAH